jgi:hypothetical protein
MKIALCCVADEKTKYLSQALRWARAIRLFGVEADLFVGLTDPCPDYFRDQLQRLGVRLLPVPKASDWHGPSNKLGVLVDPALRGYDFVVLSDCDIVVVGDIADQFLPGRIRAKPADMATLGDDVLERVFASAGLALPTRKVRTSIDRVSMHPYCNSGFIIFPGDLLEAFMGRWLHWNQHVLAHTPLLGDRAFFTDQASFAMALSEFIDHFEELPIEMNFPCHLGAQAYPADLHEVEPRILHYHDRVDGQTGLLLPTSLPGPDRVIARFNDTVAAAGWQVLGHVPAAPVPVVAGFSEGRFVDPSHARVLIGILSCEKYRDRADGIRNSWLKLAPSNYQVLFVHGRPGQAAAVEGDCLFLDCPESYETLPEKVHAFLAYSLQNLEFDYLFKTDDDSYLDLERFIGFDRQGADYIGHFRELPVPELGRTWHYGKCTDKDYEVPYERPFTCAWATGGGYFLSRKAAAIAARATAGTFADCIFEDLMIGEALTLHPDVAVLRTRYAHMGVLNPLMPKDMLYVQDLILEKRRLADELRTVRRRIAGQAAEAMPESSLDEAK